MFKCRWPSKSKNVLITWMKNPKHPWPKNKIPNIVLMLLFNRRGCYLKRSQSGNAVTKRWITLLLKRSCLCWFEYCFNYFWQSILVLEFLVLWCVFNWGVYFVNLLCFVCWYANGLGTHLFWMILFFEALFTWLRCRVSIITSIKLNPQQIKWGA